MELSQKIDKILKSDISVEQKRIKLLGRKGLLSLEFKRMKSLPKSKMAKIGKELNNFRQQIQSSLNSNDEIKESVFDLSAPASRKTFGAKHPISITIDQMVDIFSKLGFEVFTGNEAVSDYDNFGSLNFSPDHPARDTQDSFMLKNSNLMMRTQTSAMQIEVMKKQKPPIRAIVPGKTFRRELDATHVPMFNQLEGFIVDKNVSFSDLKGLLSDFVELFFEKKIEMRFRPHYFPFTEPSAEIDILWKQPGKKDKWLEILGCGSIHPSVLINAGINPKIYQGIAFGLGIERPFMLKYGVNDMRELYKNEVEFLKQLSDL